KQYECAEDVVKEFVDWRFGYYVKRYERLLENTQYDLKYWRAMKLCFDKDLPAKLIGMKNRQEIETAVEKITKKIGVDDKQMDRIVSTPTYHWTKERYHYILEQIKLLEGLEIEYTDLLGDHGKIKKIFRSEIE